MRLGKNEKRLLLTLLASDSPLTALQAHDFCKALPTMYDYPTPQIYQAQRSLYQKRLITSDGKGAYGAREMVLTKEGREKALEIYQRMIDHIRPFFEILVILRRRDLEHPL